MLSRIVLPRGILTGLLAYPLWVEGIVRTPLGCIDGSSVGGPSLRSG